MLRCFVCGLPRSEESIKEGKRREREERAARLNAEIFKKTYGISKSVFIFGITVSFIIVAIMIIIKIVNGQLDNIWNSATAVAGRIGKNLRVSFAENLPLLIERVISGHTADFLKNIRGLWVVISENLAFIPKTAFEIIPRVSKNNIDISYKNAIIPMARNISSNVGMFIAIVEGLFSNAEASIGYLINVAIGIINGIGKHFN